MLEVGCGSGFIASYFSGLGYGQEGTYAVDVVDERQITKRFSVPACSKLLTSPFADEIFDFIINHVVEHVGSADNQIHHLSEIFRCLEPGGKKRFTLQSATRPLLFD